MGYAFYSRNDIGGLGEWSPSWVVMMLTIRVAGIGPLRHNLNFIRMGSVEI